MLAAFRDLLRQLQAIQTSDVPLIEWHHKLCFLGVVMGEKPAFAIGFDEVTPPSLVHFLDQQAPLLRLFLKETPRPPRVYLGQARVPPAIARAVGERWDQSGKLSRRILWVYKDPSQEALIERVARGEAGVHEPLGYPECCANAYQADQTAHVESYFKALQAEHGASSEEEVLALIRQNVPVSAELPGAERALQTVSRFPYLPYIACHACLAENGSEAAEQNNCFRRILARLDPMAARRILVLAKTMAHFGQRL